MLPSHFIDGETEAQAGYLSLPKAKQISRHSGFVPSVLDVISCAPGEGGAVVWSCLGEKRGRGTRTTPEEPEGRIKGAGIKYH